MVDLFGYVKPRKSELLVRELEEYGGVYCTLCRRLGKTYGAAARLALNYDCTFYALVLLSVSPKPSPCFQKGRCVVNPLKKCACCADDGPEFEAASALTVILLYHKLLDDLADSRFWKKLLRFLPYPFVRHAYRKAVRRFPAFGETVSEAMEKQREAEHGKNPGLDFCAEPSASMLGRIMELSYDAGVLTAVAPARVPDSAKRKAPHADCVPGLSTGSGGESGSPGMRVIGRFGYCLGRWIYLIDAADDLSDDLRTGSFNPFAVRFGLDAGSPPHEVETARAYANQVLNQTLCELQAAFNLMELNALGPIVRNVVFLGLPQIQKERLFEKEKRNVRSL